MLSRRRHLVSAVEWEDYYARIQDAYDHIAEEYDATVGRYAVSRRAKKEALGAIERLTPRGGQLLDIGCYTGEEALLLARKGYRVVGTDLSPRMIGLARQKASRWNVQDRIQFEALRASDLSRLLNKIENPFDTVYSVYGTLNLEPHLKKFKGALLDLMKPAGSLVCGLLNPTVLYELVVAPLLLQFHGYRKLPRRGVRIRTGIGGRFVEAFLYSPLEFAELMKPEFALEDLMGLHFFYPPPRGKGAGSRWWIARALDAWEKPLQRRSPFHSLGFFSLLVFRRR